MTQPPQTAVFGKRSEPHTVIIARGDSIHHFTVRPWVAALVGSVVAAAAIGYLVATSYLVFRDDLLGAAAARQARMQQSYEDRISALRAQVDRITSRQLLDQQLMESKVTDLLNRQAKLADRNSRLAPMLERAAAGGQAALPAEAPPPEDRPDLRASANEADPMVRADMLAFAPVQAPNRGLTLFDSGESAADRADKLFVAVNRSLRHIETEQLDRIRMLTDEAYGTAGVISDALEGAGIKLDRDYGERDMGGPLVAPSGAEQFDAHVEELDEALATLDGVKKAARALPIANPAPGKSVSSAFGVRKDPILGRPAMHAGIDFRSGYGAPARATGAGEVVKAGWNGGYGRMVEIDHGHGLTTRYAHLSAISVEVGDRVRTGDVVGKVGSSGRSTGPHLHYEVRREGKALNPVRFLKAGKKIASLL